MYYKPRVEESMEVGFRKVAILPELTLAYLSVLTSEIIMLERRLQEVHFFSSFKAHWRSRQFYPTFSNKQHATSFFASNIAKMAVGKNKRLTKGGKKGGKKKMYVIKLLENDNQMFDGIKFTCLLCRCCILILIWSDRSWVMLVYMCAQFVFFSSTYCILQTRHSYRNM